MVRQRLTPEQRKEQILKAATTMAEANGVDSLTRDSIAKAAGCAEGLVTHYFKPFDKLIIAVKERLNG